MWEKILLQALEWALCRFFEMCAEQDDCPDGVCDDAAAVAQELMSEATVGSGKTKIDLSGLDIQWDQLDCLITSAREFVKCFRAFLGLGAEGADMTVGDEPEGNDD